MFRDDYTFFRKLIFCLSKNVFCEALPFNVHLWKSFPIFKKFPIFKNCLEIWEWCFFISFPKNANFGKQTKTASLDELYIQLGTIFENENFDNAILTYSVMSRFHFKKPEC